LSRGFVLQAYCPWEGESTTTGIAGGLDFPPLAEKKYERVSIVAFVTAGKARALKQTKKRGG
jgi:hypothetical protein